MSLKNKILKVTQFIRDPKIVAWVLNNANDICECCKKALHSKKEDNSYFLEVHHFKRLSDGCSDAIDNSIAVCPNCHRELHYGENRKILIEKIFKDIKRLKR